jgi:hypothetical protein
MNWIIGIAVLVLVGFILDREIYFYEGVHWTITSNAWKCQNCGNGLSITQEGILLT